MKQYRLSFVILTLASSLKLSGCSVGREYTQPEILEQDLADFQEQDTGRFIAAEPVALWWKTLNDDPLSQLIDEALAYNHDIRIAIANVEKARAISTGTEFDRLPTIEGNASAKRSHLSNDGPSGSFSSRNVTAYDAGFDAVWEADLFGRVSQRIARNDASYQARVADLKATYITIAAEVARSYIELRGAQHQLDVGLRNANNQRETLRLTQRLTDKGSGTELDISRATTQLELTESSLKPLEAQINATINRLSVLLGKTPDALKELLKLKKPLPSIPESISVGNAIDLFKRRPDILSAERELAASVAQYNIDVADLYPVVTLEGSIGFLATSFASLGTGGAFNYVFGPAINWSILDLGHVQSRIDASDAQTRASLAQFEKTVLIALEEIDTAMVNFSREEQRRDHLFKAAASSAKAANIAKRRFEAGIDSFLDVLDAERTLLEAENLLALSEVKTALDLITIYKALGGGWETAPKPKKPNAP
jgi:multidrug efflux system outer membrane protein